MAATPLISVVIASYNHEAYVRASLDSVVEQGLSELEILVTDDASTDATAAVVAAHPDPRIHLHVHRRNRGACAAMNQAIGRARGRYVAVLNSDDIFLPGKLAAQLEVMESRPELAAVFGLPSFMDEAGQPLAQPPGSEIFAAPNRSRHAWLAHFFDQGNALCHPTALVRREVYQTLGLYDERLAQVPDFDMWVRLCTRYELQVLQQPLTGFRLLPGQRNASAPRPEVVVRDAWERAEVMRHYLALSPAELKQVFPEFEPPSEAPQPPQAGMSSPAVARFLALRALAKPPGYPFYHRFGLDALHASLPRQAQGEEAAAEVRDFIARSGAADLHRLYPPGTLQPEQQA